MNEQLWKYVRGVMWDYEEIPDNVEFVERGGLLMYKTYGSSSILSNKIAKVEAQSDEDLDDLIKEIEAFFDGKPFSWWIGPDSLPVDLEDVVRSRGFLYEDTYFGLIKQVEEQSGYGSPYDIKIVESEGDVRHCVNVSSQIWGYNRATKATLVRQRLNDLGSVYRRGGFLVVLDHKTAGGYAGYRFSKDGKSLYLSGTGVLPEYRHQGIYRSLLNRRIEIAHSNGAQWIVTQARKGTSEPILRKLGFEELGVYQVYTNYQ